MTIAASIGFGETGTPQEIFLSGAKDGSGMAAILEDASVVISVALQHGIPVAALAKSISRAPDGMGRITAASVIGAAGRLGDRRRARPHQAGTRVPAIPAARVGQGQTRMAAGLHGP
jgi:hypothetical protein